MIGAMETKICYVATLIQTSRLLIFSTSPYLKKYLLKLYLLTKVQELLFHRNGVLEAELGNHTHQIIEDDLLSRIINYKENLFD